LEEFRREKGGEFHAGQFRAQPGWIGAMPADIESDTADKAQTLTRRRIRDYNETELYLSRAFASRSAAAISRHCL